jgi:hypothetical protein
MSNVTVRKEQPATVPTGSYAASSPTNFAGGAMAASVFNAKVEARLATLAALRRASNASADH